MELFDGLTSSSDSSACVCSWPLPRPFTVDVVFGFMRLTSPPTAHARNNYKVTRLLPWQAVEVLLLTIMSPECLSAWVSCVSCGLTAKDDRMGV